MYKYRFTIFTATYNRASMLEALYQDIKQQNFDRRKFEWVIVSDGSTDNTCEIVESFKKEGFVNIKFLQTPNGGKHSAWRYGTEMFEGRYVITADDDDRITPDMLSVFDRYWTELEQSNRYEEFWEVRTRSKNEDGLLVGAPLPPPYFDSDYIEVNYKLRKSAEMTGCRKVEILKNEASVPSKFPFDEKCSNYPECIRWTKAAQKYKTRFVPDITRTYVVGHNSLTISTGKRSERTNYNSLVYSLCCINEIGEVVRKANIKEFLMLILQLSYSSIRVKEPVLSFVNKRSNKLLVAFAYIPASLVYLIKRK